jgi:hypothetical protein
MKFPTFCLFLIAGLLPLSAAPDAPPALAVQPPVDPALYATIKDLDARLFAAFNSADLAAAKAFFAPDVEFYHDKDGLSHYEQTIASLDRLFHQAVRPQRTLIPETLEVYPIKDFGAVQIGSHRFCVVENGQTNCSVFKFIHIWRHRDGQWQLVRIISVDH